MQTPPTPDSGIMAFLGSVAAHLVEVVLTLIVVAGAKMFVTVQGLKSTVARHDKQLESVPSQALQLAKIEQSLSSLADALKALAESQKSSSEDIAYVRGRIDERGY